MSFVRHVSWLLALGTTAFGCSSEMDPAAAGEEPLAQQEAELRARFCAGPRDRDCPDGFYCGAILGVCPSDGFYGICRRAPEVCTDLYDPVCGCDGETYGNRCYAQASGVAVDHRGECETNPDAPACGGFPGTPCPGSGTCTDDPRDTCDPDHGGADCIGLCECNALGLCVEGQHWDSSPDVCACVPDENPCSLVLCPPDTQCEIEDGAAVCNAIDGGKPCGDVTCGPGLECCNASCGICTPPGRVCIQIACD